MQKWEYKMLTWFPSEKQLNELGAEGWELVAVGTISASIGSQHEVEVFLKRRVSN